MSLAASFFTVDDAGNVSIGNSSPQHTLDVTGAMYSRLATTTSSVNWDSGNVQSITLTSSPTLTFSNAQAGGKYDLIVIQDGTGGRTITWPASVKWSGGAPTLSSGSSDIDLLSFVYDGTDYLGSYNLNYESAGPSPFASIDSFNSYSDGDLSGGNGGSGWSGAWSGDSTFDIQSSITLSGSGKAVAVTGSTSGEDGVNRTFSDVESGHMYFAMRASQVVATDYCTMELYDNSTLATYVSLAQDPNSIRVAHSGGSATLLNPFSSNTWYIFDVEFLSSTTFRVRYKVDGGSWNSYTSNLTYTNSVSSPNKVNLACSTATNGTDFYIDEISTSDPD